VSDVLAVASAAARAGGDVLREGRHRDLEIEFKDGPVDLVTAADRRSQEAVCGVLLAAFGDHAILGEEGTVGDLAAEHVWIVDPLDGTTNYAHGWPLYAVSIALCSHGEIVCGVVYDPDRDDLFAATAGGGATVNGRPLHVSSIDALNRSLLVTQVQSADAAVKDEFSSRTRRLLDVAGGVRNFGAPALVLCGVAAGRLEAYCERAMKPWDVAAGGLILTEAGGRVTDFEGRPRDPLGVSGLVATNERIHDQLLEALAVTA
jgi:myo-inositol-1(or 4)-monophosphatase